MSVPARPYDDERKEAGASATPPLPPIEVAFPDLARCEAFMRRLADRVCLPQ